MTEPTSITEIHEAGDGEWFTIAGEVTRLAPEDELHEKMEQKGRIRDGTASIRFTHWGGTDTLDEGDIVLLNGVVTDEYHGNISISLNSATDVATITEESVPGDLDARPRRDILREFEDIGPNKLDTPDVERYAVSIDGLRVDAPSEPFDDIKVDNFGKRFAQPLWDELGASAGSLMVGGTRLGSDYDFHNLSLYGVEDGHAVIGMTVRPSNKRSDPERVESFRRFIECADAHPNAEIETEGSLKWMAVGECAECDALVDMNDHLGVNVYGPDEDYIDYYDWWHETRRHNLSIPDCPECGEKELYPVETAKVVRLTYRAPLHEETVDAVEETLDSLLNGDKDASIHFTKNETLRQTGERVLEYVNGEVDATGEVSVKDPGVGRRYSDIWPKRYIVLSFNGRLSEGELEAVGDAVREVNEGIYEVSDTDGGTMVKLAEHKP